MLAPVLVVNGDHVLAGRVQLDQTDACLHYGNRSGYDTHQGEEAEGEGAEWNCTEQTRMDTHHSTQPSLVAISNT